MKAFGEQLRSFDLEEIKKRAAEAQANQRYSQANGSQQTTSHACPKCRDEEGYFVKRPVLIRDEEHLMDHWVDCECKEQKKAGRIIKSSRITLEFQKKTFDSFSLENVNPMIRMAYQIARTYFVKFDEIKEERSNSICLLGNPGSGKTHLMMAIANELMQKGVQVLYFPWVEGFNEIKDNLSLTEERINRMQKSEVLFIDDMWKGRKEPTAFQIEQIFAVINYRYMEKKPVLISSEKDIDQMCDYDEAIGSRINEMCKDFRVILKGGRELNYRMREDAS